MIQRFDRFFIRALLILSIAFGIGCAGPWERALREDTPASYYHYMRDHPDSKHHADAQEHLDFLSPAGERRRSRRRQKDRRPPRLRRQC